MSALISDKTTVIPSHRFISTRTKNHFVTAKRATTLLSQLGLIRKKHRGFRVVNHQSNFYRAHTCEFSFSRDLLTWVKKTVKHYSIQNQRLQALFKRLPFLFVLFVHFATVINNSIKVNINNKDNTLLRRGNCSIFHKLNNVFGEDSYLVTKNYLKGFTMPTTTLSIPNGKELRLLKNSLKEHEHTGNIQTETHLYSQANIIEIKKLTAAKRDGYLYIPNNQYKTRQDYLKPIPSNQLSGLISSLTLAKTIETKKPLFVANTTMLSASHSDRKELSASQIAILKKFPFNPRNKVKNYIKLHPEINFSFKSIFRLITEECQRQNINIVQILKEHGLDYSAKRAYQKQLNGQLSSQPYKARKNLQYTSKQATIEIDAINNDINGLYKQHCKLLGEVTASLLRQQRINTIKANTIK